MTLHFVLNTSQGKLENKHITHSCENFAVLAYERKIQCRSTWTPTTRQSLSLPGTPTTNTKGNDMGLFCWNKSKLARIAELQSENVKLRNVCDEVLEREHELDVQVLKLQAENDNLVAENKSVHNIGIEYRDSAERLAKERDELKVRLDGCQTEICKLHNRLDVFENAIRTAVSIAGL